MKIFLIILFFVQFLSIYYFTHYDNIIEDIFMSIVTSIILILFELLFGGFIYLFFTSASIWTSLTILICIVISAIFIYAIEKNK